MDYATIICDLKNSARLENRQQIQYELIETIKQANSDFADIIASPFIITLGDEWQGLLKNPEEYSEVIDFFRRKLPSIDFYCGVGIGEINIFDFELTVNQLDGPSFHKARKAINIAKRLNYSLVLIQ
ncbi:MAG: hypothetical protein GX020_09750 [Firmicutes bacterium]|nr:hypothetical protein [Bacillota bacterium]